MYKMFGVKYRNKEILSYQVNEKYNNNTVGICFGLTK